jgi:phosphate-selective porin
MRILALATLLILSASASAQTTYTNDVCDCQVKFPGEPAEETTQKEEYDTYKVTYTDDPELYFLAFTKHNVTVDASMTDVSIESFTSSIQGEVISTSEWKVKGADSGKTVIIVNKDQGLKLSYSVVINNNIQYQLVYGTTSIEAYDAKKAKKFMKSFKL